MTGPTEATGEAMQSFRPLVTVIVTNYNYAEFLPLCIDSVLSQIYSPIEIIVVDDGSTDGSLAAVSGYSVKLVTKANGGQCSAVNAGFAVSTGEVVVLLDADDVLYPGAIEAHVAALSDPSYVRSEIALDVVDRNGSNTGAVRPGEPAASGDLLATVLAYGPQSYISVASSGNAWSRGFLDKVLPLPEHLPYVGADAYLMDAAPLFGLIAVTTERLGAYRDHAENLSKSAALFTRPNVIRAYHKSTSRCERLSHLASGLNLDFDTKDWQKTNWRRETFRYFATGYPSLLSHLRAGLRSRTSRKRRAGIFAAIFLMHLLPDRAALHVASRIINLRYV